MAEKKEIIIDINVDGSGAKKGATDLRTEFKQIQKELRTLAASGDTASDAFLKLEARAGELKDQIGDMNDRVNILSSDFPKLDLAVGVAKGIAAGFAAAQGAMALFGSENKNLEKALLKVQGAMALLQGITELSALTQKNNVVGMYLHTAATKVYTFVTSGATLATKAFRAALVATGIGAIIFVLTEIISLMSETGASADEAASRIKDAADLNAASYEREAKLAKAKGNEELAYFEQTMALQSKIYDNQAALRLLEKQQAKDATDERKKQIKEIKNDIANLQTDIEIANLEYDKSLKEKEKKEKEEAEKKKKAAQDQAKENARRIKEEQDRARAAANKLRDLENEAFAMRLKDERERELFTLVAQQEKEKDDLKNANLKAAERTKLEAALQKKQNLERVALLDKFTQEDKQRAVELEVSLQEIKNEAFVSTIKDEGERALKELDLQQQLEIKKLDAEVLSTEERNKKIDQINESYRLKRENQERINTANALEKSFNDSLKNFERQKKSNEFNFETRKSLLDLEQKALEDARSKQIITDDKYNEELARLSEERNKLAADEKASRTALNNFITDQLTQNIATASKLIESYYKNQIAAAEGNEAKQEELRKKSFERKKQLDIANALVATYSSAINAFNSTAANTALTAAFPAAPFIAAGAAIAAGLANVAQIRAQKYTPSGGSGGGGGRGSSGSTGAPNLTASSAAITPAIPAGTNLSGAGKDTAVRAYVVESDISSKQKRMNKLKTTSKL